MADPFRANPFRANPRVLSVFSSTGDRASLSSILAGSGLDLVHTDTLEQARRGLTAFPMGAVITEGVLRDGHGWKDVLADMQAIANPPPLIVAARLANEALWAEVLNLGGYDLLMMPFQTDEVVRVMTMACGLQSCAQTATRMAPLSESLYARSAAAGGDWKSRG